MQDIAFKSSNNAEPSGPVAERLYSPQLKGTVAPTVVEQKQLWQKEQQRADAQQLEVLEALPMREEDLLKLPIPEEMKEKLALALRKRSFVTITYITNSGRIQRWLHTRQFPNDKIEGVLDLLKQDVRTTVLGKPDVAGAIRAQLVQQRNRPRGRKRGKRKKRR